MTLNEAMNTGPAHFTHLLSHPILAAVQGLGLKYLASYQDEGFEVIARPGICSLKDLEGKKVSFATPMMKKNFFYAFRCAGGDPGTLISAGYGGVIQQTVMGIAMTDLDYLRDGRIDAMALWVGQAALGEPYNLNLSVCGDQRGRSAPCPTRAPLKPAAETSPVRRWSG